MRITTFRCKKNNYKSDNKLYLIIQGKKNMIIYGNFNEIRNIIKYYFYEFIKKIKLNMVIFIFQLIFHKN